jgi:hypothetical protein
MQIIFFDFQIAVLFIRLLCSAGTIDNFKNRKAHKISLRNFKGREKV